MSLTLSRLQQDHKNMGRVLSLVESQAEGVAARRCPDFDLLNAVILYVRQYTMTIHQAREELILAHLVCHLPKFERDILSLLDEHHALERQVGLFDRGVRLLDRWNPVSRGQFCEIARAFIDYEAKHIEAEEKFFYPRAKRWLTPAEWAEVDSYMPNEGDPLSSDAGNSLFAGLKNAVRRRDKLPA